MEALESAGPSLTPLPRLALGLIKNLLPTLHLIPPFICTPILLAGGDAQEVSEPSNGFYFFFKSCFDCQARPHCYSHNVELSLC